MIVNVCFGTNDLARGAKFYEAIAAELGLERYMDTGKAMGWRNPAAGIGLAITLPFDGKPATVGNGVMATIGVADRAQVDKVYALGSPMEAATRARPACGPTASTPPISGIRTATSSTPSRWADAASARRPR